MHAGAVGRVGQTAGVSDDRALLRAHTWHQPRPGTESSPIRKPVLHPQSLGTG